ncbi:pickpocket protein 19 [Xylocopa sonorina]|uniref:pickpocket protein 19 n=1 Tax=Xylocopa sonorina TaxID=1818115 RepID=UPI00403A7C9D
MPTINPRSNAGKYFVMFASSSTIHGLNHVVAPNKHPIEKLLAVLCIIGALLLLILLSLLFWDRYQNDATVTVVRNDRETFEIFKPALFICPVPAIELSKIPEVFKRHNIEHTSEAERFFTYLANATYENMLEAPVFDKVPPTKWLEILYDLRRNLSSNLLDENDPFENWVSTERGFCLVTRSVFAEYFTINYWKSNNLTGTPSVEKLSHYEDDIAMNEDTFPVESLAMMAVIDPTEFITYNIPKRTWITPGVLQEAVMSISQITSSPDIKELSVHQRNCKFINEGGLKMVPAYSKNMCITECRMKIIQDYCNCRPHFTKPIEGVNTCNAAQLRCIGRIVERLFLYELVPSFCGCVPKCDVIFYQIMDYEVTNLDNFIKSSIITLHVKLPQIIYSRELLYSFTDFLTSVGGAAGLFLGASLLSFVEIFYYASLRLYFYVKETKRKQREESDRRNVHQ